MTKSERERILSLIDALLDNDEHDGISEAEFIELDAMLQIDSEARQLYYARLNLHTALDLLSESETPALVVSKKNLSSLQRTQRTTKPMLISALGLGLAATLLTALGLGLGWWMGKRGSLGSSNGLVNNGPVEIEHATGFATILESEEAVWEGRQLQRDDLVPPGALRLRSGRVDLELFSGVTLALSGETEFELISSMEMALHRGSLRANVPEPAQGFQVRTASGKVVDLGTEFAIQVEDGRADVHVLDGEVEWHAGHTGQSLDSEATLLIGGSSIRSEAGRTRPLPFLPNPLDDFLHKESDLATREAIWGQQVERLKTDPRLVLYYPMSKTYRRAKHLVDASPHGRDGVVIRRTRSQTRWQSSDSALDFSRIGSGVRMVVPGEYTDLTLMAWVRIDGLERQYNSLFLTDGHEIHEPHWQFLESGSLFFSIRAKPDGTRGKNKHNAISPKIWTPARAGQWMHVASAYNSAERTTTHFVNGEIVSVDKIPEDLVPEKIVIGGATLGNWSEPYRTDPTFALRNLNGTMDEFAIFSAPLSAEEIMAIVDWGRP